MTTVYLLLISRVWLLSCYLWNLLPPAEVCLESYQTSLIELFAKIGNSHLKMFNISLPIIGVGKQILYSCEKSIFFEWGTLRLGKENYFLVTCCILTILWMILGGDVKVTSFISRKISVLWWCRDFLELHTYLSDNV